jgi:prepilin-type N-terminal cleavage/methylation domain-containing protein
MSFLHAQRAPGNALSGGQSRARLGRGRSGQRGLTLVELLIAVALLGFILLGIAPLFIASVKSNYSANEYTSIHILARDRLEQLMNLTFNDAQLAVGFYPNDQALKLVDPVNASKLSTIPNPFTVTYQVTQWSIPPAAGPLAPAKNAPFVPNRVSTANQLFQYKRIDVEVRAGSGPLGIGSRVSRVSGGINNPRPGAILADCLASPGTCILSLADPCPAAAGCSF